MKFYNIIFGVFICLLCATCNIINPPEKTPTYIHIDSFKFNDPRPGYDGSASHAIGSVWVSYGGRTVGVFDLPCTVPIIAEGSAQLALGPGVTLNGMSNFQAVYPYYFYDTSTLTGQPGKVINYTPQTSYISNGIAFPLLQDFELGTSFDTLNGGEVPIARTTAPDSVFEGKGSGIIRLNKVSDSSELISSGLPFAIPQGQSYCEFNYKGTLDLTIGMLAIANGQLPTPPIYLYGFYPSATWKKMYVSLGEFVQTYPLGTYKLIIKASLPAGQTSGYLLLDNIKVVDIGN